MFNNLQAGTTIKFYLGWINADTVGVIESKEEDKYKVAINGLGVSSVYVPFNDVIEIIDKTIKV